MLPSDFSSGDSIADRRADYARMLAEGGDPAGAADLMEQALERTPDWTAGWFNCGSYHEKAGNPVGAIAAFQRTVALDAEDLFGATLKLAALGSGDLPDHPSSRYIERFFDDYAERFDVSLVEKLDYDVPEKLATLLAGIADRPRRFSNVVDLGCGTGLFGAAIRHRAVRLEGFDLSRKMLARAEVKQLYDHLGVADLSLPADQSGLFTDRLASHRADLIVATDVMIYLGRLETIFERARQLALPNAVFAFSVEELGEGEGLALAQSLRYAHSVAYVEAICRRYGFLIRQMQPTIIRMDAGKPVAGLLFVTQIAA